MTKTKQLRDFSHDELRIMLKEARVELSKLDIGYVKTRELIKRINRIRFILNGIET